MGGSLQSKFLDCISSEKNQSYPFGSRHETLALITQYAEAIQAKKYELDVSVLKFKDKKNPNGNPCIMFSYKAGSSKGPVPPCDCQLIFPPHFPKVPPIFAVKATGIPNFENSRHANKAYRLPTKAFEVKMEVFQYKTHPEELINEFLMVLTRDFPPPFTKSKQVVTGPFPELFDERYNNIATIFPFDCKIKDLRGVSLDKEAEIQRARAEYMRDLETMREMYATLQSQQPNDRSADQQVSRTAVTMREDISQMKQTGAGLDKRIQQFEGVAVEDIVPRQQPSEEVQCFELESKLLGVKETIAFVEDQLINTDDIDFKTVYAQLGEMYALEFDAARLAKGLPIVRRNFSQMI